MEYINGNEDRRHFIIAKQGRDIYIREVEAGSCSFTLTREEAWKRAQTLRVADRPKAKVKGSRLIFTDLTMNQTEVAWPEAKEENSPSGVDITEDSCDTTPMTNSTIPTHVLARMGAEQISGMEMDRDTGKFDRPLNRPTPAAAPVASKPTDKQVALFNKLCTEIQGQPYTAGFGANVDRKAASAAIDAAIKLAKESKPAFKDQPNLTPTPQVDVPAGRYAVTDNEGTLRFFKLDRPTEGRWAGYTFLKMMASDETYPVRDRAKRDRIIAKIAQDPQEAMLTYGREIGACGHCGRTLTDEQSRAAGIGPVCAGNLGW
jgi:hypothetical protein